MDRQEQSDKLSERPDQPGTDGGRGGFGRRLRAARLGLGYTQEQMAHALGIRPARYSKYEIGRSEAPFGILLRIAQLAKVDLDYLIAGRSGGRTEPAQEEIEELIQILPTAAVVFDRNGRLLACNALYREQFFAAAPAVLKRGTPHEVIVRSWAYRQGVSEAEVEEIVRTRLAARLENPSIRDLKVGRRRLRIAETVAADRRLVLLIDLTEDPGETR
jgi:transcriptional regulator with XRE-family HTH domain